MSDISRDELRQAIQQVFGQHEAEFSGAARDYVTDKLKDADECYDLAVNDLYAVEEVGDVLRPGRASFVLDGITYRYKLVKTVGLWLLPWEVSPLPAFLAVTGGEVNNFEVLLPGDDVASEYAKTYARYAMSADKVAVTMVMVPDVAIREALAAPTRAEGRDMLTGLFDAPERAALVNAAPVTVGVYVEP